MLKTVRFYIGDKPLRIDIDLAAGYTDDDVLRELRSRISVHSVTDPEVPRPSNINRNQAADFMFDIFGITNPFRHDKG